ncbi:MAG: hypothetical protein AAF993_12640 [Pseudomonadota bacterium]
MEKRDIDISTWFRWLPVVFSLGMCQSVAASIDGERAAVEVSHGPHEALIEIHPLDVVDRTASDASCLLNHLLPDAEFKLVFCMEEDGGYETNFLFQDVDGQLLFEVDYYRALDDADGFALTANHLAELVEGSSNPRRVMMKIVGSDHAAAVTSINCQLSFDPFETVNWRMSSMGTVVYGKINCE